MTAARVGVRTVPPPSESATRLVLVRHGESVCNVAGVVGGTIGCTGLTDAGRRQVAALRDLMARTGEWRAATTLYASTLRRAVETAEILAPAVGAGTLALRCRPEFCELRPGEADGLSWEEFSRRYGEPDWDADPQRAIAPGGESWSLFVERVSAVMADTATRHQGELVVVACHAGVVEASLLALLPVDRPRLGLRTAYASATEWEHDGDDWRLLRYNMVAYVDRPVAEP